MCVSTIMDIIQSFITMSIEIDTVTYYNILYLENELLSKVDRGVCMLKTNSRNCRNKNIFLIQSINKCVCYYHINQRKDKVLRLINFHKNFNMHVEKLFKYINNKIKYIQTLKNILLLMITHKKYRYVLNSFFNIVDIYINYFEINDNEYTELLECYIME